jgi:hypothetical protein
MNNADSLTTGLNIMQATKSSLFLKLSVLAAAVAFQGAALAATPSASAADGSAQASVTAPSYKSAMHGHHAHRGMQHHHSMAMLVPGYGPIGYKTVYGLSLTDSQQKLLKEAQASQQALGQSRRESMKTAWQARIEQVKAGKIDPHAAVKESQAAQQKAFDARQDVNQKWLAVWDALDAGQQQKVTAQLDHRAERFAKRMQQHKHHQAAPATDKSAS